MRKNYTDDEIAIKLRLVMQKYNQGLTIDDACKAAQIGKATYFRWRKRELQSRTGTSGNNTIKS